MLRELDAGIPTSVTVTLVDRFVLSRSAFDHSMNYRSLVAFRRARKIVDPEQKINSLRVISEHLIAGRWQDVRGPSEKELKATTVLEFSIEEASFKDTRWTAAGRREGLRVAGMSWNFTARD
jgi:uncharacterized protein